MESVKQWRETGIKAAEKLKEGINNNWSFEKCVEEVTAIAPIPLHIIARHYSRSFTFDSEQYKNAKKYLEAN